MAGELRVGLLGLGRSGWAIHADAIRQHPKFTVSAVADPVPERRAEAIESFGCAAYDDPYSVIAHDVDVIVVATPSHTHVPLTLAALEAGRHVVVEKPMAQSASEVDQMIAAAERANQLVTCYQPRRLDPDFSAVQQLVQSDRLGEIILIRRSLHHFARRTDWQMLREFDGGVLSNAMPHLLDQALELTHLPNLSEPALDMFVDLRHTIGAGDAEDHAKLCLRPAAGPLIELEASYCVSLPQPDWLIVGTAGSVQGSASGGLTVRWSDPATWPEIDVEAGAAPGRQYFSDDALTWHDEHIAIGPPERPASLAFYDNVADAVNADAALMVTPQSIRRRIAIIAEARHQAVDMPTGEHPKRIGSI